MRFLINCTYFNAVKCQQRWFSVHKLENFTKIGTKCVGIAANYRSLLQILERPIPEVPDFFIKPPSAYITEGEKIIIPKGFSEDKAMDFVAGYCLALDMTATCKLVIARNTGGSWTLGKAFDTACPVSKFIPKEKIPNSHNIELWCSVNKKERQRGNTNDLVFKIPFLISYISKFITLKMGDIIITGSPPGMGPVQKGDIIEAGVKDLISIKFEVDEEEI